MRETERILPFAGLVPEIRAIALKIERGEFKPGEPETWLRKLAERAAEIRRAMQGYGK